MLLRKLYYLLGPRLRRVARRAWFFLPDLYASVSGKRNELVPPRGMIFTGAGDFTGIGDKMLQNFLNYCHLQPGSRVLDVGCGIGRIARPLTGYLSKEGSYDGFDIVPAGVEWCRRRYAKYPNFRFQYIPLRNDLYNLSANAAPSQFTFPYAHAFFDLVVLVSVFTHMQEAEVKRYIAEIARVLRPGGNCLCTFFLITPGSDEYLKNSKNPFFPFRYQNFFLHDERVKDANVAYKRDWLEDVLSSSGLRIESFYPGWWAGSEKGRALDFQDILIISH